tara:strand:- start:5259 stop:6071 length:813 start_codon:yes stop_codon:yes gene_type:complete
MINVQDEYRGLLSEVLYGGKEKNDRTGTGTRAIFGRILRHNMELGFPLLTAKKIYFNHAITELLWILQGRTDMYYLRHHGVTYWDDNYKKSGRTDNTLGPVYGKQLRDFDGVDQLKWVLEQIKQEPSSRRIVASLWNPVELGDMALPPCHYGFQVYINDDKLSLAWSQRSVDVFLGLPYDLAIYGLLLLMLAKGSGYKPGDLVCFLGDCHLYNNHLRQSAEYLNRADTLLPTVELKKGLSLTHEVVIPTHEDITLINYNPASAIKAPLAT